LDTVTGGTLTNTNWGGANVLGFQVQTAGGPPVTAQMLILTVQGEWGTGFIDGIDLPGYGMMFLGDASFSYDAYNDTTEFVWYGINLNGASPWRPTTSLLFSVIPAA
jgi:hypothetical protein